MNRLQQNDLLYLVTDSKVCGDRSLEDVVESAILGGVNIVQLREKHAAQEEFLDIGRSLKMVCDLYKVPLIINDNLDVAIALDAAGVHLGQSDLSCGIAREELGGEKIIGLSVNTLAEAQQAEDLDVDYLGVGPIFPTETKLDVGRLWEMEELRKLREISRHTLVAIGGIKQHNFTEIIEIGFDGIAVVSAICAASDPKKSAEGFLKVLAKKVVDEKI